MARLVGVQRLEDHTKQTNGRIHYIQPSIHQAPRIQSTSTVERLGFISFNPAFSAATAPALIGAGGGEECEGIGAGAIAEGHLGDLVGINELVQRWVA